MIDHTVEVQAGDDSCQVATGFLETTIFIGRRLVSVRNSDLGKEDVVAQFVGENVEILAIGAGVIDAAAWAPAEAELQKAITGLRVVPFNHGDQFQTR